MKLKKTPKPTVGVTRMVDGKFQRGPQYFWGTDIERQIWIRERVPYVIPKHLMFKRSYTECYPLEAKLPVDAASIQARIKDFIETWQIRIHHPEKTSA